MADNNHNRDTDNSVAADDPFAELARLLSGGSEEARPTPSDDHAPADALIDEAPAVAPVEADPFGVDLERELLGDIEEIDAAFSAGPAEPELEAVEEEVLAEPVADEPVSYDAPEEPDVWADDELAGTAEDSYTEDAGSDDTGSQQFEAEPNIEAVHSDDHAIAESVLAEVDMDFGELDVSLDEPVAAESQTDEEPAEAFAADDAALMQDDGVEAADHDAPAEISLEDELEMLLSGGPEIAELNARAPEPAPSYSNPPSGAVAEAASRLGRANYVNAAMPAAVAAADAWDNADADIDDSDDEALGFAAGAEAGAAELEDIASDEVSPEEVEAETDSDPFADLAAIMARSSGAESAAAPAQQPSGPIDIETMDVPEGALEQTDDLDLPDLPAEEPVPPQPNDEFDGDLGYDFQAHSSDATQTPEQPAAVAAADAANLDDEDRFYAEALGFGTAASAADGFAAAAPYEEPAYGRENGDGAIEDEISIRDDFGEPVEEHRGNRNGFMIAGAVVAVALIGGIGAFALSFSGGDDPETPVLVQADSEPVKVKPESPGGATVPEQDSAAHEAANGVTNTEPKQESLVSTTEEPVNIASRAVGTDRLPGVDEPASDAATSKSEERLEPVETSTDTALANDVIAVQPRKVRTMIVRPDGTLVPREEVEAPAAAPAAVETALVLAQPQPAVAAPETTVAAAPQVRPAEPATTSEGEATAMVAEEPAAAAAPVTETASAEEAADPVTPTVAPVATSRPAAQQRTQTQQVAQAAPAVTRTQPEAPLPAPTAQASSAWSMQIASQPTAESAQATYQDLARRYGELLGGRGVNIVRAEIPGKGTYFRVRIPTSSRADGIALCERYKSVGGSCFVSK